MTVVDHPNEDRGFELFESLPLGVIVARGSPLRLLRVNRALADLLGYRVEEMLALSPQQIAELVHPEDRHLLFRQEQGLVEGKPAPPHSEIRVFRRDGTLRWLELYAARFDFQGEMAALVLLVDITAHKEAVEALRRQSDTLVALHETALDLAGQRALPDLLRAIVARAVHLLGAKGGGVYLYRPATDDLEFVLAYQLEPDFTGSVLKRGEGLSGKVLESGRPLAVADYSCWEGRAGQFEVGRFAAVVAVPILWGEHFLGILNVLDDHPRTFSADDISTLERLALLAGTALEQRRLLEETRARWHEAETLAQAGAAVTEVLDLDKRLERILQQLGRVVPYDSASVQLLHEGYLEIVGGQGFPDPGAVIGLRFPVPGDNPNTAVVTGRRAVILADAQAAHPPFREPPHNHIRSWLGVPLIAQDRVIGIFALDSVELGHFNEEHIRLVTPFANQVAVAIEHARLYEQTVRLKAFNESIVRSLSEVIVLLDADGLITFVNPAGTKLLGYTPEELVGRHWESIVPPDQRPILTAALLRTPEHRAGYVELELAHKNGQRVSVLASAGARLEPDTGSSAGTMLVFTDITERVRAERALRESEERYRRLIEVLPDGVAIHQDGLIRMANQAGARLLGYDSPEEVIGLPALSFVHPDDRPKVIERIREQLEMGRSVPPIEERFVRKDGSTIDVEVSAGPFLLDGRPASLVVIRDTTERKRLEEQLRRIQKMEAISSLAGGIAHDFNNILTSILGYACLIQQDLPADSTFFRDIGTIIASANRAAELTRQLLTIARRSAHVEITPFDPNMVVREVAALLERTIDKSISIELRLSDDLYAVKGNIGQIHQALLNLCLNARDAMPQGGRLVLETQNVHLSPEAVQSALDIDAGDYVLLGVTDTGVGMDASVREHLFEPFFTTKETGQGLGLAMAYGIVRAHRGAIHIYSEVGQGTTVKVYLPAYREPVSAPAGESPVPLARGGETVLITDDEPDVRDLLQRILERGGYTVLSAADGQEAVDLYRQRRGEIDLVILDMAMPRMGGQEAYRRLREIDPQVKVLLSSGLGLVENLTAQIPERGERDFLPKPYTADTVLQRVRQALDSI